MSERAQLESPVLRRREAAAYLGIAEATLTTWAARGQGPPYARIGSRCVYRITDLDAYIAARVVRPGDKKAG